MDAENIIKLIKTHRDKFRDAASVGADRVAQTYWEIAEEYDALLIEIEAAMAG